MFIGSLLQLTCGLSSRQRPQVKPAHGWSSFNRSLVRFPFHFVGDTSQMSVTDELLRNNETYARSFKKGGLPLPPAKHVAVLACMDARLDVHKILGLAEGDAHVIRNAGGVATDDAIRSLLISQRLLGTNEIILIHHTDCGMLTFKDDEVKRQIESELGVRPPFALEAFGDLAGDVKQSIARIYASPFIPNKSSVRGFIYDVRTGHLSEVKAGVRGH
jgi:carbonic anhydrase